MFKPIRFFPDDSAIAFIRYRSISYLLSGALTILALALFAGLGLNYGIDFRGGSLIEIQNKAGPADLGSLRSTLSGLQIGDVEVQEFGSPDEVLIRVEQQEGGEDAQQVVIEKVKSALGDSVEYRRVEVVGPKVSSELVQSGAIAVLVAIIAVLIYIWFRFEWQFAVGAVLALVHDVTLTIGVFAVLQIGFDLTTIAALLTIVGYSLNDTVVVFDRVRENLRKYKKMDLKELLSLSINETLSRTVMTSGTTLIALFALFALGGDVIRGFVFAMIWGIFVGTYSSVFVASTFVLWLGVKRDWSKPDAGAGTQFSKIDA